MNKKIANITTYLRGLRYFKRALIWNNSTPLYFIFFITSKCNLRCSHCFYWRELNKKEEILSLEEINKISLSMNDLPYLRLTGGEPSLRNDFADIASVFYRNNNLLNLGVNTNGFFTEKIISGVKKIAEECPNLNIDVCVSIDDAEIGHDNNRGVLGTYRNAMATLKELNKLREIYPKVKSVIGFNLNKSNQKRLDEIYSEIMNTDVDYICDTIVRGDPKDPSIKEVDIENYKKLNGLIHLYNKKRHHHAYFNINAKDKMVEDAVISSRIYDKWWGFNCTAGVNAGVMYADGSVFPCEGRKDKIGNIRDFNYNFRKLWNSDQNKKIRNQIREEKCFCTHENFITASIFSRPGTLLRLIFKTIFKK